MFAHIPVLLNECLEGLNIKPEGVYVDATLGGAGHSSEILKRLGAKGMLYCFDKDNEAIEASSVRLSKISNSYHIIHADFRNLKEELTKLGVNKVDGILFDLGVSSHQLDTPKRGFSYKYDAPLDMRMNQESSLTAFDVVNKYSEEKLCKIMSQYGEEKHSKSIARKICEIRRGKPISTTFELVDVIKSALPSYELSKKGHPAKQVFQAIRIEVNDELNAISSAIEQALYMLNPKGRIAIITFHSLEDRIVKNMFRSAVCVNDNVKGLATMNSKLEFRLVNSHPIVPLAAELDDNNRSHSAKLRVIEKL